MWGVTALVAALVVLILPSLWSSWQGGSHDARMPVSATAGGSPGSGPAGPQGVDLSSMTPREAADRLFNRVMAALSAGNQGEVQSFLPMAIDAYRLVPNLDHDGLFHLSLLQQAGGDYPAAAASAQQVLESDPNHLLALYAAAEAAQAQGDAASARGHYQRILNVFESENARGLPEYTEHGSFLATIREAAREYIQ
ncbi:MAG: tetratricopeptide repeat protein [Gemmatimonadota bacterium]